MRKASGSKMNEREFGQVIEALKNLTEDRKEDRAALERHGERMEALNTNVTEMRGAFNGMNQTMQSSMTQLAGLATERCGERLDKLERDCAFREARTVALEAEIGFYKRVFGGAYGIVGRLAVVLAALVGIVEAIHQWG